jgi:hypothetical protein
MNQPGYNKTKHRKIQLKSHRYESSSKTQFYNQNPGTRQNKSGFSV